MILRSPFYIILMIIQHFTTFTPDPAYLARITGKGTSSRKNVLSHAIIEERIFTSLPKHSKSLKILRSFCSSSWTWVQELGKIVKICKVLIKKIEKKRHHHATAK